MVKVIGNDKHFSVLNYIINYNIKCSIIKGHVTLFYYIKAFNTHQMFYKISQRAAESKSSYDGSIAMTFNVS